MIQKPNIKFPLFPNRKLVLNYGHKQLNNLSYDNAENEMDHNLRYRGLIWMIQKSNIKFTIEATTSMKNTSPNSLRFPTKNQSQILDSM